MYADGSMDKQAYLMRDYLRTVQKQQELKRKRDEHKLIQKEMRVLSKREFALGKHLKYQIFKLLLL